MNHLLIAPIVLPAIVAPFIIMVVRYHLDLQRIFSIASTVAIALITLVLASQAADGTVQVYELGDWPAPFGIVLVLDRLSAMMIVLTAVLALAVVLYAIGTGWDARGANFHALFQFQLMGIIGAFLTGDAFNLFVFFEVLLIASYGLMIHAGGATRFQAGVQYVVYNLLGSTLFLFALGTLYSVTGTLNMADLAVRVAELPAEDTALLRVGAIMLLLVFAIKAAVLPLHFWLPASYANAPLPVAALFAIMTKVGAYAILRMYTLVFGPEAEITAGLAGDWLLPAALLTLAVGAIGVLGAREIGRLVAFGAITSMGTLLTAVALFTPDSVGAALYYTVHSTLATAFLFLVADMVMERQGGEIAPKPVMKQSGLIAALFFGGSIAMAGMPPLSGFLGKLLVMDAARGHDLVWWIWGVILVSSLITIIGLARAGSLIFWKSHGLAPQEDAESEVEADDTEEAPVQAQRGSSLPFVASFGLLAGLILLTVFAGPMMDYAEATSAQLFAPDAYIDTVLGRTGE
ncbi:MULTISPECIES: monovalent cation/H+ antiporter subunit D [Rhodobacterales]|jgi:multicomponent K+:H+ antiporter subunit D|uniref:monovalent cation/H+ antiporter subunit D n=1 Tax=Rhodobacterales TaxID=204455 RepID=UPI00237F8FE5|nr:monovalent cation/H+ antiporter subunit D [Phaeobacter gallaeciensis]MDE4099087.1 monovalent cation/H+ antiporter subunit D [Phaeobacter gallaeciensis]MDE4107897.1 monovalent cation/H+ antiporter subunit D [Phaeobacter gallaeciensis]MDE4112351.1 monovalent cation/H+ antiporter subunit D [Phaeobacter gallaeciensis]MDE4116822.1 monovalent cation/H+ antiporter subunit D [Phaeobacter gallaeciensis]MDE4121293.1 monovalent cation/H+ antiporter subunit D [Phaeobacter gallaeciensis]